MVQIHTYGDERQLAHCAFCGGNTGTRDHCPSRVFLDEPYPENLPVVPACFTCNARFSADEQYLACLLSCVVAGSTDPARIARLKIRRILTDSLLLRARLERSRTELPTGVVFNPEYERVSSVITKLAQGHALYELHTPCPTPPDAIHISLLGALSDAERNAFECPPAPAIWPEVGSRALQRLIVNECEPEVPWIVVQSGLYRFHSSADFRVSIRIVIHEYLACCVQWT